LIEQALAILQRYVDEKHGGSKRAATIALGMNPTTGLLGKWLRRERVPSMTSLAPILEMLGVCLNFPEAKNKKNAAAKDVCFVNAKAVPAGEHIEPPHAEDYLAAPLVGEVGAGRGYIAQEDVESWFLLYKRALPDNHSGDLFAVQIGKHSRSMQPTLYPGDIVLVDKGARIDEAFGRLMLVRDEDGESGMIKRVELTPRKDGDALITYYSDNAAEYPPVTYSLQEHFGGELRNAIVGRVIWAWSNVRNK